MHYAQILPFDVCNGEGIGVSLFVQGCHFQCPGCFNQDTWDFNGGKEWTLEVEQQFLDLINRPYIKRVTLIGGDPLAPQNIDTVVHILKKIMALYPTKQVWLYTGYTWEEIFSEDVVAGFNNHMLAVSLCDVLVDGRYIHELRDYTLKFRGSSNQRVIDVPKTLRNHKITLYCE